MNLDSFDRTLQDDLHRALADTELPSLDPDALVATGGRLLRRRNRTRALTGVAAAVAVALGGYAAQGNFVRDAAPNPPASQTATDTASPTAPVTTVLERLSGVAAGTSAAPGDPVPGPTHFAVTVSPVTADGQDLTYSVVADDGTLTIETRVNTKDSITGTACTTDEAKAALDAGQLTCGSLEVMTATRN